MKFSAFFLASLVAISGCATKTKCLPNDGECQAKEENSRRAALMMFSNMSYGVAQNARDRQIYFQNQPPISVPQPAQEAWQPTMINPNRWGGTTYCNSQGICQLKRF